MGRRQKVLQVPTKMANLIGSIIDARAVIGFTGLLAFFGFAFKKAKRSGAVQRFSTTKNDAARNVIIEHSNEKQNEITDALDEDDPAGRLAKLGNERRRK